MRASAVSVEHMLHSMRASALSLRGYIRTLSRLPLVQQLDIADAVRLFVDGHGYLQGPLQEFLLGFYGGHEFTSSRNDGLNTRSDAFRLRQHMPHVPSSAHPSANISALAVCPVCLTDIVRCTCPRRTVTQRISLNPSPQHNPIRSRHDHRHYDNRVAEPEMSHVDVGNNTDTDRPSSGRGFANTLHGVGSNIFNFLTGGHQQTTTSHSSNRQTNEPIPTNTPASHQDDGGNANGLQGANDHTRRGHNPDFCLNSQGMHRDDGNRNYMSQGARRTSLRQELPNGWQYLEQLNLVEEMHLPINTLEDVPFAIRYDFKRIQAAAFNYQGLCQRGSQ